MLGAGRISICSARMCLLRRLFMENTWERQVYLPERRHVDLDLRRNGYEGSTSVTVPADISRIPVFLRGHSHSEWIGRI